MRIVLLIFFSLPLFLLAQQKENFTITFNKNIETYFLAEILAADHRKPNKSFEQYKVSECSKYQPIVKRALAKFKSQINHPIAKLTAALNDTLLAKYDIGNDNMMHPLLYHNEFPATGWNTTYQYSNTNKTEKENKEITLLYINFIDELWKFFIEEKIDAF